MYNHTNLLLNLHLIIMDKYKNTGKDIEHTMISPNHFYDLIYSVKAANY
jgi:hypothetical protein